VATDDTTGPDGEDRSRDGHTTVTDPVEQPVAEPDDEGHDDRQDDDEPYDDVPDDRRRIVLIAGVAFLIIAVLAFVLTRDGEADPTDRTGAGGSSSTSQATGDPAEPGSQVSIVGTSDAFDTEDADAVPALESGAEWEQVSGTWGIRDSAVAVVEPSENRNFLVVDVGYPDLQAQMRLATVSKGAGFTFRYQDEFHYWALEVVPEFSTLNIIKVIGGDAQGEGEGGLKVLDKVADVPVADGTTIGVILRGDDIDVVVNSKVVKTLSDSDLAGLGRVGFTTLGPGTADARFDDFTAGGPTGEGVIGSNDRDLETPPTSEGG